MVNEGIPIGDSVSVLITRGNVFDTTNIIQIAIVIFLIIIFLFLVTRKNEEKYKR